MHSFSKHKRNSREMRCVLFPEDNLKEETFTSRSHEPSKAAQSWERCSETFLDTTVKKTKRMSKTVQLLERSSTPVRHGQGEKDPVHISWSSSDEEQSECQLPLSFPATMDSRSTIITTSGYHCLPSTGADGLLTIDSDSEHEENEHFNSKEQIPVVGTKISDYSSSDSERVPEENIRLDVSTLEPKEHSRTSVSEWVRSAQAVLQTPQKQTIRTSETPEDSGKKRHRYECGGLAERLNRLQCRQKSAVSFWRHKSVSNTAIGKEEGTGVLVLHVQSVQEMCGMQAALCKRHSEKEPCVTLFNKDTASHLAPTKGNILYVYPPWQSLTVEGEQHPIILNTHFSRVLSEIRQDSSSICPNVTEEKTRPCPLIKCLWQSENLMSCRESIQNKEVCAPTHTGHVFESLLEAVEASGPLGSPCGPVKVVIQRVYFSSVKSSAGLLRHKTASKVLSGPPQQQQHSGRFCILVQDVYGMFGEVELQYISLEEELKHYTDQLEGKVCVLQDLKVFQRLTRERCTRLFSLIDSLWPPLVPVRVHGEQFFCQTDRVPTPSFCYRFAGQQGCVVPQYGSLLYRPPIVHTLQQILEDIPTSGRCSFQATVIYKREQKAGEDLLIFVTDNSLQGAGSRIRTLSVYVSCSCLLQPSISQVIASPQLRPTLLFRDAVMHYGQIFCWEQSVVQLSSEQILHMNFSLSQPILLDKLSSESSASSLCALTGVVVDMDEESAFSWPTCCHCGSDCLETVQNTEKAFLCTICRAVDRPTSKMHLEVFLSCPSISQCTVKLKLHQKSITTLLRSTGCTEGYDVENVFGKKVGPLSAFIHDISKTSTLWISLEEIII